MAGVTAVISTEDPSHKHASNPYFTNIGTAVALGSLFGVLQTSWYRVPSEDILANREFAPGHGAAVLRNGFKWGALTGGVALAYTAGLDFGALAFGAGEGDKPTTAQKQVAAITSGLFLGARAASPSVFLRATGVFCAVSFVTDLFPDLQTLQYDVRRDAATIRRKRLEAYEQENAAKATN